MVAWATFAIVVGAWIAFGYALLFVPETLQASWEWVRGQNVLVQSLAWLLGLPWMIALAVWQSAWVVWARFVVIACLAAGTVGLFAPWRQ